MVTFKNRSPLLPEYIHSLFGTCVQSNELGLSNFKLWPLKVLEKSLNFIREQMYEP